jgi:hypothetical protein
MDERCVAQTVQTKDGSGGASCHCLQPSPSLATKLATRSWFTKWTRISGVMCLRFSPNKKLSAMTCNDSIISLALSVRKNDPMISCSSIRVCSLVFCSVAIDLLMLNDDKSRICGKIRK